MSNDVLMKHIAPGLGTIIAWLLFTSPLQAVLLARKQKALGSLNPLPFVAMWANCAAWLVYSFLTRDYYVLASNEPGLIIATFLALSCYGYAEEKVKNTMLMALLGFSCFLSVTGAVISFGAYTQAEAKTVWGMATVTILIIFYSAPLSVVAEVLKTRSSAALYLPFAIMNVINGSLWAVYGLAVPDAFIWGPNLVGAVFGGVQVVLCIAFPSRETKFAQLQPEDLEDLTALRDA